MAKFCYDPKFVVYVPTAFEKVSTHETERGAKIAATRAAKKTNKELVVITVEEYREAMKKVPTKKVINLMSGKEVEIPINTPACCDPSTETYWSL